MADIDLKTETPDTTLPTTGFLFGADSQAAASPSVFTVQSVATTLLGSTTLTGATITTSSPVIDAAQTWNAGGVTFTGLKFNATDTASAAGSLLMDLQRGGVSQFRVRKDGVLTTGTAKLNDFSFGSAGSTLFLGCSPSASIGWFLSDAGSGVYRTVLTSPATANLRFGAADAAAPVAQTLSVQSGTAGASALTVSISGTALTIAGAITGTIAIGHAVTGTGVSAGTLITAGSGTSWTVNNSQTVGPITGYFNSVGQNLTITGSQASGPSPGGSIIFQIAPGGAAATTAQNALANILTLGWTASNGNTATFTGTATFGIPSAFVSITSNTIQYFGGGSLAINPAGNNVGVGLSNPSQGLTVKSDYGIAWDNGSGTADTIIRRDAANTLALRNGAVAQESRVYGSFTAADNFQRMSIKTLRESSGALSGATYVTTIAIPAYANLIGVTTRVTTEVTGATTYDVGDGSDVDLWGAAIGVTLGSQSRTADFTAVAAVGAAATSRTVTLTANGSNFTGGVIEICLHYLTTEAD